MMRTILPLGIPMESLIFVDLPLPPDELHPNARPYWRVKAELISQSRQLACLKVRSLRRGESLAKAAYRLHFRLPRKRDEDGLVAWVKAYIDGFVDGDLLVNDSNFYFDGLVRSSGRKETDGKHGVTFVIWPED